ILGRRRQTPRFPGDPREAERRPPGGVMTTTEGAGTSDSPETRIVESALPEGSATGPVAGHLYFAFKGKPKKIKSLELLYDTGERQATLRLH
ncbi:MAG TPA: hypothetical protein VN428_10580, partial [Bryobacteraceae bacterium]|nr:hypothetical protein [Bryobacteraceae bacterium]